MSALALILLCVVVYLAAGVAVGTAFDWWGR